MIVDQNLRISATQALTSITDTSALSTNSIDLSVARDIGEGKDLYMNFAITTAVAGGTSTAFEIIIADDAGLTSNVVSLVTTGAVATANLTLGTNLVLPIPPKIGSLGKRYLGARYTVVGTNSAGAVTTDITSVVQDGKKFYASGFTVA
jgi:hypothetical protein